ncbi:MAG: PIN domain nuclease [Chloroflexi bacterium]|nr:PIN domain nuclease [Chloroflexota bacterium]
MFANFFFRLAGALVLGYLGWRLGQTFGSGPDPLGWLLGFTVGGVVLGFLLAPAAVSPLVGWFRRAIVRVSIHHFVSGLVGLAIGLGLGALLAPPLSLLPGMWGQLAPIVVSLLLGYIGVAIVVAREGDILQILGGSFANMVASARRSGRGNQILLDTSAIIDGRIADVSQTGFIQGALVIPKFILDELQFIADSTDSLRRNRGRRGLEVLNRLQKETTVPVQVLDVLVEDADDVDSKLVKLAKRLRAPIVTGDYNLNRVAELQGVKALNVNQLANALRPVVLPGEELSLRILQEGKEMGQGVGFMDDGTMVVVEGGRRYLNRDLSVVVSRVLQTAAGRIIFAHPRGE